MFSYMLQKFTDRFFKHLIIGMVMMEVWVFYEIFVKRQFFVNIDFILVSKDIFHFIIIKAFILLNHKTYKLFCRREKGKKTLS